MDVNDAGDVVLWDPGSKTTPEQGFVLDAEGSHLLQYGDRGPLVLLRINNRRQVLGLIHSFYGPTIYSTSADPVMRTFCPGSDLNDRGDVTALGCKGSGSTVRFDDGSYARIPDLGRSGYWSSAATAINNRGEVAGSYHFTYSGTQPVHAFLWDGKQTFDVEYDSDEWRIDSVSDLNDAGVILAHATNTATGQKGAVLLHPLD